MKKITRSFLAVSLSTAIIFQHMAIVSNGEEINAKQISQDTLDNDLSLSNINSTSKSNSEKNIFVDPLLNPYNRIGNEFYDEMNSKNLRSATLDPVKPFSYPNVNTLGRVTADLLNVRENPSASSKILSKLNKGSVVQILSKEDGWYKISYFYRNQISSSTYDIVFNEAYVSENYITAINVEEKGIDVSKWNGTINWSKVKSSGIDYAIIRAGYGTDTIDPMFKSNIEGAIEAGVKVGVYWFSYASSPEKAKIEANKCLEVIAPYKNNISYPIFFDFETSSADWVKNKYDITVTKSLGTDMAKAFMDTVELQGYTPGLYTGIPLQQYFSDELLDSSYTWLAQYSYRTSYPKQFSMWQYGEDGYVNGISGSVDINYTLGAPAIVSKPSISSASINDIDQKIYTGSAIKPSVTVTLDNKTLKLNEDYTVTYSNNISVGTAKILIKGIGNYTGEKTVTFKIVAPTNLSSAEIGQISSKSYTGSAIKPSVIVKYNDKTLTLNKDYTLTYSNNINIGTAKILIKGIGNYTGQNSVTFKIIPKKISNVSLSKKTTNSLTLSWSKLANVTGYKVYKYNKKTNTYEYLKTIPDNSTTSFTDSKLADATIYKYKVRGYKVVDGNTYNGSYSDILTESTKVKTVTNLNLKTRNATSLKISWDKVNNADGYKIYSLDANTDSYKLIDTIEDNSITSYTHSNRLSATNYYYKVKAYKYLNGSTRHSDYSSRLKATTRPVQPSLSLSSTTSKSIKASWTKISKRTTGYEVRMSTSQDEPYKSIGTTTNTSFTKSNLSKGKTYYFKVRAYRIVDGEKIYSLYSHVKSIKCK